MSGVEVLHSSEVFVSSGFNGESFLITFIMCIVIGLILGVTIGLMVLDEAWMVYGTLTGIIFGLVFGTVASSIRSTPEEYETHYKVLISDEVSMNEFLEKYEVIDQEGRIYTVKEKVGEE